jgi:hypothetical protein
MRKKELGFSLVEIVIAIGIFAFVAVAILSLLSVALKMRAESSLETKSSIIAEELFSSIKMAGGIKTAMFRDGPALQTRNNQFVDLTKDSVVLGYPNATTVPFGLWHSARGQDPKIVWESGNLEAWAIANQITTLAYLRAEPTGTTNLYKVICEVRSPATLPQNKSKVNTYSTLFNL